MANKKKTAKGMALTIGLNSVDKEHYGGWTGDLIACEADADDMTAIAKALGFDVRTLLTADATRDAVTEVLEDAASKLVKGDLFMLSYSGHGGQVPDLNEDENDEKDETWCLYDGQLVDDELHYLLAKFELGVRVIVFSDSCHSGTAIKEVFINASMATQGLIKNRAMPRDVAASVYRKNQEFYDNILTDPKYKDAEDSAKASILLISGCQDSQTSMDGTSNGLFTSQLLTVWNNGKFKGNYRTFHKRILKLMPPMQTPNYYRTGTIDPAFEKMKALRI